MSFTPERLRASLLESRSQSARHPSGYCVALSGGLDSTVLLRALVALRDDSTPSLRAIHVDHALHADSAEWSRRCVELAHELAVPIESLTVDARAGPGESPEAAARAARYQALAERLRPDEFLLTAHHADDQMETVLLQLLRGGGLRAAAGMPRVAAFAQGFHARPLLEFTRAELEDWARQQGCTWLEDPSNLDARFDRNYLRLHVLPAIRGRWPAAARTVGRVAGLATEALEIVEALASDDLETIREGQTVRLDRLNLLPAPRRAPALRAWLRRQGLPLPTARQLAALSHDVASADEARVPCTRWPGASVYRYRGRLYAERELSGGADIEDLAWNTQKPADLGPNGRLVLRELDDPEHAGIALSKLRLPGSLTIRGRQGGESLRPAGSRHHRDLRKWLQEQGVLPWMRQRMPLVYAGKELAAVGDLVVSAGFAAIPGEPAWRIAWLDRPRLTERDAIKVAG